MVKVTELRNSITKTQSRFVQSKLMLFSTTHIRPLWFIMLYGKSHFRLKKLVILLRLKEFVIQSE